MANDKYVDQKLDGRFHLVRLLDSGSFGAVYEAHDIKLGRIVAVKILFEKDEMAFRKEAKLAVQFDHPNVVKVYDYGADSKLGVGYIVMEFLKGCRLDQLITKERGRVSNLTIVRFVDQIGGALQLAHERNLIHRDLKPQNVMLVEEDTLQERFVLLDLGLASQTNSTSTLRNQTLDGALSPRYASPEQLGQDTVDFRSDIYSFGTILYELVSGEVPFVRDQLLSLMMAICNDAPPPFKHVAPDREVTPELELIIQQCLSKKRTERPESIRIVRSRILTAFGADTAMPIPQMPAVRHAELIPLPSGPLRTGTLLPPMVPGDAALTAGSPTNDDVARPAPHRPRVPGKKSESWTNLTVMLLILVPVLLLGVPKLLPKPVSNSSIEVRPSRSGRIISADEIQIDAGSSNSLQLFIEPPDEVGSGGNNIKLTASNIPEWLKVLIPAKPPLSHTFNLDVTADSTLERTSGEFTLNVVVGEWKEKKTVRVSVIPPKLWALPRGFEPLSNTKLVRTGTEGRIYYREIVRSVNPNLRVEFILISPPENSSGANKVTIPFYIMKQKVWNELFSQYWSAEGYAESQSTTDSDWKLGAMAAEQNLPAASHPKLPTVRVNAYHAHRFAVWLGEKDLSHLPSVDQWDSASGYILWESMNSEQRSRFPDGPFRGPWMSGTTDVCVDRRQLGPKPVGESIDDVTITGCTDMAGNVLELTETLMNGARVGEVQPHSEKSQAQVLLRGRSYLSSNPLRWDDIRNVTEFPDAIGYDEIDPTVGFRVVIETTR